MTKKITVNETGYPDWPLATLGVSVVQGDPKGSGQVTFQTGDKLVSGHLGLLSGSLRHHLWLG